MQITESIKIAAREYFNLYGVENIETAQDGTVTENGTYELINLATSYQEVQNDEISVEDAFVAVCAAYREHLETEAA